MEQQETNTATLPAPLLTQREVAMMLGKSESWLERARWAGTDAPKFRKIGRAVRYSLADVEEWIDQQPLCSSTTETGKGVKK